MKTTMRFLCVLVVVAMCASNAFAQGSATAQLSGTVKDPSGSVVANVTITIRDAAKNIERSTTSNALGNYQFLLVPPGQYTMTVVAPGFAQQVLQDITLTVGQVAQLPVALSVAEVAETLTVSSEAALVETQRTSDTTTIEPLRIQNLPINGPNYIDFAKTDAQVKRDVAPSIGAAPTSGLNFGGQRARSNLVNVDGLDAVDNSVNGIRSTASMEAVQEFQIITNSYAAEYGRASGGVVNIITRSGTNEFHGSAFAYLRHRSFQADNPFTTVEDPAYTRVRTGFTLGGPLVKDRTFWFGSFETTQRSETGFSTIGLDNFGLVPYASPLGGTFLVSQQQFAALSNIPPASFADPNFQVALGTWLVLAGRSTGTAINGAWPAALGGLQAFFNGVPLPDSYMPLATQMGNYPVSEGTSVYSFRLDHRINDANNLMLRVSASPSRVNGINVQGQNQPFGQNGWSRVSTQNFRDFNLGVQHLWTISNNKINEFRFQFARRGLRFDRSDAPDLNGDGRPDGDHVASNIIGTAFIGHEPFSFVDRVEKRWQFMDHFNWTSGNHNMKFGVDFNYLPLTAAFTVNFFGVYNFGNISPAQLAAGLPLTAAQQARFRTLPAFSPLQAYGMGIPSSYVQGIGDPNAEFSNKTLGLFWQDSWRIRPNLTLNYGVRYDVEYTPTFEPINALAANAYDFLDLQEGIAADKNNFAPRIGIAWDPWSEGKTVIRASYGMFFDHPLLGVLFLSNATDGSQTPQLVFSGGAPGGCAINATNAFQGTLGCLPASFGYLPNEQRFDPFLADSIWINQNYLGAGVPLGFLPFGFPAGRDFDYAYSQQANVSFEHELGHDFALGVGYNFNGGRKLHRPVNVNSTDPDVLLSNMNAYNAWAVANAQPTVPDPRLVPLSCNVGPAGPWVSPVLANFFRPSGFNPTIFPLFAATPCVAIAQSIFSANNIFFTTDPNQMIPFSDMVAQVSTGSSVYHAMNANLKKRFGNKYEFLASYTWSHAIDDSTDLQSLLAPQNNRRPELERSNSTFDQRHRLVISGVYQSGKLGDGFWRKFFSDWTLAPIVEIGSGRPFTVLAGGDFNFDFGPNTDRPMAVDPATDPNLCGAATPTVASEYSPTGFFRAPCFLMGEFTSNVGRNSATRPKTIFTDLRVSRRFRIVERVALDGIVDMFNIINRFNVGDVNVLYTNAGQPTSAHDPRQFQFGLKLTF